MNGSSLAGHPLAVIQRPLPALPQRSLDAVETSWEYDQNKERGKRVRKPRVLTSSLNTYFFVQPKSQQDQNEWHRQDIYRQLSLFPQVLSPRHCQRAQKSTPKEGAFMSVHLHLS